MKAYQRLYYLFDPQKKFYRRAVWDFRLKKELADGKEVRENLKETEKRFTGFLKSGESLALIDSRLKKTFWEKAPSSWRMALFLSWELSEKGGDIANVEIDNWLEKPFFEDCYSQLRRLPPKKYKGWSNIWRVLTSTKGTYHLKGLRFGNIHLSEDLVQGKVVHSIHWDRFDPGESFSGFLKHNLYEVLRILPL